MAFVLAHPIPTARRSTLLHAGRTAASRLWARRTPQQRAAAYVSRMPVAVITASLGGHPTHRRG
ncbi:MULTISPECIES: hypothetical protein [Mycobacterium]|uniref:Uncharacterized protein n=1 Tax=Mycobacterium talmoniae TaxID=1858794 RepID=A0A1S1NBJ2_9MYCO|nr:MULTISPECIES: hypothetical protein [Mycobacterium]OHU96081.1 hypothetical protein BKN37_22800 [Mycobacterium talmoniae]PQM49627.1 hypothetical protein C1Y40_00146 [Mycobacterium talmoniae]TDH51024.1 hypothetical protein E2F47_16840 [Mycobacterium eburneum]